MPMTSFAHFCAVALGGAAGASLRYALGLWLHSPVGKLPIGVLTANIAGCFIAGFVTTVLMQRNLVSPLVGVMLTTGLLGGFTTFSAFSVDTLRLMEAQLYTVALLNVLCNVLGALFAVGVGWYLGKMFLNT